MPDKAKPLRLKAEDAEDLAILSAALQDAVGKIGDIRFEAKARRLTLALNRYRWEAGGRSRVRSALQLGSVEAVEARRLRRDAPEAVVELLALSFEPDADPPGGSLILSFAGGGDLKVKVECLDAVLADVSAPWPTPRTPQHES
ncbi:MAG: DUF2948 family protein [Phenylobacterium sp.]|uniref:DUF2948 family protein n=1 Tax=Phenylobacterium sp. TaxID=1871053 RepID=UPI00271D12A1|nr:DUF2948 family protein [Phenylobacterium sp.]MDO8900147.1 DUF2948 family protein [Phenylobacterium sp.]MDP2215119.1 DUF2948 family protein [Phenylobacterium sp.]